MQLTVRDVATLLKVSERTIYRWIKEGTIPAYRISEQYRFHRAELLEWATARRIDVSADIFEEAEDAAVPCPASARPCWPAGSSTAWAGTDKESVLRAAVEAMRLPDEVDREQLPPGAPGARVAGLDGHRRRHRHPARAQPHRAARPAPDDHALLPREADRLRRAGRPAGALLFTLVSPTVRAHLHLLSRLAFALRDPALPGRHPAQGLRDEILAELRRVEAGLHAAPPGGPAGE